MSAQDKVLDGAGLAVVDQILEDKLAAKQDKLAGTAGQVVGFDASGNAVAQSAPAQAAPTLLSITFGESSIGEEYTVAAGTENYTGMVLPASLDQIVAVKQPNTEYTVSCGGNAAKVTTGAGFGPMMTVDMVFIQCLMNVTISGGTATAVKAKSGQAEIVFEVGGRDLFIGIINRPGNWRLFVTKSDGSVVQAGPYTILAADGSKDVTVTLS